MTKRGVNFVKRRHTNRGSEKSSNNNNIVDNEIGALIERRSKVTVDNEIKCIIIQDVR